MSKAIVGFVGMVLLVFAVIFTYQFGLQALGSSDQGVNLTGTQYQSAYNSSVNTSTAAYAFLSWQGIIIGVVALVFLVGIALVPYIKGGF